MLKLMFVLYALDIWTTVFGWPPSPEELRRISSEEEELEKTGLQLFNDLKYKEALPYFEKALSLNPTKSLYHKMKGDCHSNLGQLNEAIEDLDKAVKLDPQDKESLMMLASALLEIGNFDEAIKVTFDSDHTQLIEKLGSKLYFIGKYEEAITCYTEAIARRKTLYNGEDFLNRGLCYKRLGDMKKAVTDFRNATQISDETGVTERMARQFLHELLFEMKNPDEDMKKIIVSEDANFISLVANNMVSKNRYDDALYYYNAAIEKDENNASNYGKRGFCYQAKGDLKNAIKDFDTAAYIEPRTKHFWIILFRALVEDRRFNKAREVIKTLDRLPGSSMDYVKIGELRKELETAESEKTAYERQESTASNL